MLNTTDLVHIKCDHVHLYHVMVQSQVSVDYFIKVYNYYCPLLAILQLLIFLSLSKGLRCFDTEGNWYMLWPVP